MKTLKVLAGIIFISALSTAFVAYGLSNMPSRDKNSSDELLFKAWKIEF